MVSEATKVHIIESVTNKELMEELYVCEPFVCDILLQGYKEVLDDDTWDSYERKLSLLKFLKNNYPLEISREIVDFVSNCDLAEDYRRIILEWNYFASDYIKQYVAAQYDTQQLAFDLPTKQLYEQGQEVHKQQYELAKQIAQIILDATNQQNQ